MSYSEKTFVISTHVFATGPAQDLKEYLLKNDAKKILFIGHPLFHDKRLNGSGYEYYEKGEKVKEYYQKLPNRKINLVDYFLHAIRSVWCVLKSGNSYDLYVGSDNVNAAAGVILKRLGKVKKTVYYVIDYNPHRFKNKIMNSIYHWVDRFCVRNSDETWNLSPRMEQARKDYFGFSGGRQKVVPIGVWLDRIKPKADDEIDKHTVAFMGHITKKQGVQHIIKAIPSIVAKIPDFRFLVIGDGDYLNELRRLAKEIGITDRVEFTGYVEDSEKVEERLTKCAVAVALYEKYDDDGNLTFTYFSDPAKIKMYLACGLVTVTSKYIVEMEQYKDFQVLHAVDGGNSVADILIKILSNDISQMRIDARSTMGRYDWKNIFNAAFRTVV